MMKKNRIKWLFFFPEGLIIILNFIVTLCAQPKLTEEQYEENKNKNGIKLVWSFTYSLSIFRIVRDVTTYKTW